MAAIVLNEWPIPAGRSYDVTDIIPRAQQIKSE
jgi:hypothetical protein